jgi:hypothetical protein
MGGTGDLPCAERRLAARETTRVSHTEIFASEASFCLHPASGLCYPRLVKNPGSSTVGCLQSEPTPSGIVDTAGQKHENHRMHNANPIPRREFLRRGGTLSLSAAALAAAPNVFLNRTLAQTGENPSELIRVGIIGTGGQGRGNMSAHTMIKHVVALCDVDKATWPRRPNSC